MVSVPKRSLDGEDRKEAILLKSQLKRAFKLFDLSMVTQEGYSQMNNALASALLTSLSFLLAPKGG